MNEQPTFAQEMFRNQHERNRLEDALYMLLRERYQNGIEDIKCIDEYDYSVEFWIAKGATLDAGDRQILRDIGFNKCWLCVRDGTKEDEVYYPLHEATP